ncbi:DUF547 domain-containing protein [Parendozoicomonas sp. Alg238-R29]|uniref:DUF547 domain-containing protein n=1 Tax=Parendozoicomonas sp. Alg238-R29 TaxID=2993446 RepID=UPI00248F0AE0|nr:DUF547 domain-containing protein [Parendozoicomonas sp. Alg238-R29]
MRKQILNSRPIFLSLFLYLALVPAGKAAPSAEYWPLWDKSDERSTQVIDHQLWDDFLKTYIQEDMTGTMYRVKYKEVTSKDKQALKSYLSQMQSLDPRAYSKDEQFAYWVNLYNALTVRLILDNYPVKSIRKIGSWLGFGPWDNDIAEVAGQELTLNDIEHRILRPIWKDARIHYAVNCASVGCPDLFPQAWTGENKEQMLEQAARRYARQSKGFEIRGEVLFLSSIYDWYNSDFGSMQQLKEHLTKYAPAAKASELRDFKGTVEHRYDWNLNRFIK